MVKKPVRVVIAALAAAAERWIEPRFERRMSAVAAVQQRTGYSLASIDYALDRLFGSITRDAVESVVAGELGSLDALDGFVERIGRPAARALPLGRVCIVSSRTTIGVAIVPAAFAIAAKCDVSVKDREDHLVAAFFETLCEELPELRASLTAKPWLGAGGAHDLHSYDGVVAFGSDATLGRIASSLSYDTRFIGFGSKASAGYVTREALSSEAHARAIAESAALDLVLYETEGCLSLHALFVERDGAVTPERFAELMRDAMRAADVAFPPATLAAAAAARRGAHRDLAAFRSGQSALAVLDPPLDEPPAFLPRTLAVRSVGGPNEMAEYFERHRIALEALAVVNSRPDVTLAGERLRVARIARLGTLQAPPLGGFHGGRPRIAEFVRWIASET